MDPGERLADFAARLSYEQLGESTVSAAKLLILDSLANIAVGAVNPKAKICRSYFEQMGGKEESTVLIFGDRLPAPAAAFVNGVMLHTTDFDDTHSDVQFHAMCCIFPAALACAEAKGGVDGRLFITAIVAGTDIGSRTALAMKQGIHIGWLPATVSGGIGAAAAAGRIMDMDGNTLLNAMGIQYGETCGNRQALMDRAGSKHILPGFTAQSAVISTYLAREGLDGPKNIFRGAYGLANLFCGGELDEKFLFDGLGERFETERLGIKPYPACRETHAAIDAALKLYHDHGIRAEEIESVETTVPDVAFEWCGAPFEIGEDTNLQMAAQFNIPYTVAIALAKGSVGAKDFMPDEIKRNGHIRALASRVRVFRNEELKGKNVSVPVEIRARTKDGREVSARVEKRKGDPDNPMTVQDCRNKFLLCWKDAGLDPKTGKKIIEYVENLEGLDDIGELVKAMTP